MNFCATKSDESGSTWADSLIDIDMGGAGLGVPPIPAGGATAAKLQRLRSARRKGSYGAIVHHISDPDLEDVLTVNHFQKRRAAVQFLDSAYDTPILRSGFRV